MATLFEQMPGAQIRFKSKNVCVNQKANDKITMLSTQNVQKSH